MSNFINTMTAAGIDLSRGGLVKINGEKAGVLNSNGRVKRYKKIPRLNKSQLCMAEVWPEQDRAASGKQP